MIWHGLAAWLAIHLMKLLSGTLRWRLVDEAGYTDAKSRGPILVAAWHNRIFALPICYEWICRSARPLTVLTSPSRDGGLLSAVVAGFGIGAVRGSSSKRAFAALRELQTELKRGVDVIITPDGPRGPCYQINPGVLFLAQLSGAQIMAVRVEYSAYWELRSWDRFRIPKPFSKVKVHFMPLLKVERSAVEETGFGGAKERLAELLG